jgi:hypothetical protein
VVLTFDRTRTSEADLVSVRDTLAGSPGTRRVEFIFVGEGGQRLKLTASDQLRVTLTDEAKARLAPWLR